VLATLGLIYALSQSAIAWILGRSILRAPPSRIVALLVGWAILLVLALIPILGGLVWFAAVVFGLDALAMASCVAAQPPGLPRPSACATGPSMMAALGRAAIRCGW
jgi:hypothetical protein